MPRDPNRSTPTEPRPAWKPEPRVPRPARRLPEAGSSEESDREVFLRALEQVKTDLEGRLAASERQSHLPKPTDWGALATKLVAAVGLIAATFAAFKPTQDSRLDTANVNSNVAIKALEDRLNKTDASLEGLNAWLRGYFNVTGVRVPEPKGAPPAKIVEVELSPAPLVTSDTITPGQAPAIQVRTPLPAPPPSAAPLVLKPLSRE